MNLKQIALTIVLADFLALTAWAVLDIGLVGVFEAATANLATILLSVDLLLALGVATWWTWKDARRRGINPTPYLLLTAVTGSAGPLVYLIARERQGAIARPVTAA